MRTFLGHAVSRVLTAKYISQKIKENLLKRGAKMAEIEKSK